MSVASNIDFFLSYLQTHLPLGPNPFGLEAGNLSDQETSLLLEKEALRLEGEIRDVCEEVDILPHYSVSASNGYLNLLFFVIEQMMEGDEDFEELLFYVLEEDFSTIDSYIFDLMGSEFVVEELPDYLNWIYAFLLSLEASGLDSKEDLGELLHTLLELNTFDPQSWTPECVEKFNRIFTELIHWYISEFYSFSSLIPLCDILLSIVKNTRGELDRNTLLMAFACLNGRTAGEEMEFYEEEQEKLINQIFSSQIIQSFLSVLEDEFKPTDPDLPLIALGLSGLISLLPPSENERVDHAIDALQAILLRPTLLKKTFKTWELNAVLCFLQSVADQEEAYSEKGIESYILKQRLQNSQKWIDKYTFNHGWESISQLKLYAFCLIKLLALDRYSLDLDDLIGVFEDARRDLPLQTDYPYAMELSRVIGMYKESESGLAYLDEAIPVRFKLAVRRYLQNASDDLLWKETDSLYELAGTLMDIKEFSAAKTVLDKIWSLTDSFIFEAGDVLHPFDQDADDEGILEEILGSEHAGDDFKEFARQGLCEFLNAMRRRLLLAYIAFVTEYESDTSVDDLLDAISRMLDLAKKEEVINYDSLCLIGGSWIAAAQQFSDLGLVHLALDANRKALDVVDQAVNKKISLNEWKDIPLELRQNIVSLLMKQGMGFFEEGTETARELLTGILKTNTKKIPEMEQSVALNCIEHLLNYALSYVPESIQPIDVLQWLKQIKPHKGKKRTNPAEYELFISLCIRTMKYALNCGDRRTFHEVSKFLKKSSCILDLDQKHEVQKLVDMENGTYSSTNIDEKKIFPLLVNETEDLIRILWSCFPYPDEDWKKLEEKLQEDLSVHRTEPWHVRFCTVSTLLNRFSSKPTFKSLQRLANDFEEAENLVRILKYETGTDLCLLETRLQVFAALTQDYTTERFEAEGTPRDPGFFGNLLQAKSVFEKECMIHPKQAALPAQRMLGFILDYMSVQNAFCRGAEYTSPSTITTIQRKLKSAAESLDPALYQKLSSALLKLYFACFERTAKQKEMHGLFYSFTLNAQAFWRTLPNSTNNIIDMNIYLASLNRIFDQPEARKLLQNKPSELDILDAWHIFLNRYLEVA